MPGSKQPRACAVPNEGSFLDGMASFIAQQPSTMQHPNSLNLSKAIPLHLGVTLSPLAWHLNDG